MKYLEESQRPWGKYQKFYQENGVWVKRVEVMPKTRLSLQKHQHRSEKWVIVHGQGLAIVDGREIPVGPGSVVDVPLGVVHRIGNPNDEPLVFIEVACGAYLGEDDITRLQDDYARPPKDK
ncbi:MAG: phosphomannose isomerase type II C-terminal cupin domain [Candidatus Omnitrophica bacterium]|nr:phosphomannose isomerase type II C-terminal cupin domain [Candidatus Omnitrophota bacterium]MDE2222941.1 phosphomannose isomerase type II C-terminal cupin domain [Candidatus Omnitrophota bacterium]